jgi:hypothetical protein
VQGRPERTFLLKEAAQYPKKPAAGGFTVSKKFGSKMWIVMAGVVALGLGVLCKSAPVAAAMAGPITGSEGSGYRVLAPIQSGDLTLFPVVRADGKAGAGDAFVTLDEGLRSGEVEVTEAGNARGLVRPRGVRQPVYQGDQVNTLVLMNHSKKPLLLLAGEIVTGGKQDRIVASDRIVPSNSDPVDLSVFCVEHGRWTETSNKFGAAAKSPAQSFMVQPEVRQQAMVAKSQQQVWNAVGGAIKGMAIAAAPPLPASVPPPSVLAHSGVLVPSMNYDIAANSNGIQPRSLGTTSYAKTMQMDAVAEKVNQAAPELTQAREQVLAQLKQENAIGVVVAVRGEIIWGDLFADHSLLARYWVKLVRSYAAEGLTTTSMHHAQATQAAAQRFLDTPMRGEEKSNGEVGVYRTLESQAGTTDQFVLESLLPGLHEEVHVSRVKVSGAARLETVGAIE